jgi:hypothetical protein
VVSSSHPAPHVPHDHNQLGGFCPQNHRAGCTRDILVRSLCTLPSIQKSSNQYARSPRGAVNGTRSTRTKSNLGKSVVLVMEGASATRNLTQPQGCSLACAMGYRVVSVSGDSTPVSVKRGRVLLYCRGTRDSAPPFLSVPESHDGSRLSVSLRLLLGRVFSPFSYPR